MWVWTERDQSRASHLAHEGLLAGVEAHVASEVRLVVELFGAERTLVGLVAGVLLLVLLEQLGVLEALAAHVALERLVALVERVVVLQHANTQKKKPVKLGKPWPKPRPHPTTTGQRKPFRYSARVRFRYRRRTILVDEAGPRAELRANLSEVADSVEGLVALLALESAGGVARLRLQRRLLLAADAAVADADAVAADAVTADAAERRRRFRGVAAGVAGRVGHVAAVDRFRVAAAAQQLADADAADAVHQLHLSRAIDGTAHFQSKPPMDLDIFGVKHKWLVKKRADC